MIAILYRPAIKDFNPMLHEDIRIPLIDTATKFRTHQISRVNLNTKMAILMWFDSSRNQLMKNFPLIFKPPPKLKEGENRPITDTKTKEGKNAWMKLISEMASGMDNYEKIGKTNLYIAMTDISHRIAKRQEEAVQAAKAARKRR